MTNTTTKYPNKNYKKMHAHKAI